MLVLEKYCAVKQMIRGIGVLRISTYSQTLNVQTVHAFASLQGWILSTELRHQVGLLR